MDEGRRKEGRKEGVLPYVDTAVVLLGADATTGYRGQHGHMGRSHGDVRDDQKESGCELHFWRLKFGDIGAVVVVVRGIEVSSRRTERKGRQRGILVWYRCRGNVKSEGREGGKEGYCSKCSGM